MEVKLNISFLAVDCQKLVRWNDGTKVLSLSEKHMDTEVVPDALGEEWESSGVPVRAANKHEACLDPATE